MSYGKYRILAGLCLGSLLMSHPAAAELRSSTKVRITTAALLGTGVALLVAGGVLMWHSDAILRDFYANAAQAPTLGDLNHQLYVVHDQRSHESDAGIAFTTLGAIVTPVGLLALGFAVSQR
jgi:hypothetical protein